MTLGTLMPFFIRRSMIFDYYISLSIPIWSWTHWSSYQAQDACISWEIGTSGWLYALLLSFYTLWLRLRGLSAPFDSIIILWQWVITYTRCRTNRSKNQSYSSCLATKNPLSTGTNSNPTTLPSISCNSRSQAQLTPTLTSYAWTVRGTLMSSKSTSILYPIWRKSIIDFS